MPLPPKGKFVGPEVDAIFVENVSQLIADFGRDVKIHKKPIVQDCPNCGYDNTTKSSNRQYNTSNPNPLGPLNIPFLNGRTCSVCHGKGKLNTPQNETIIAAILTKQEELRELERKAALVINSLVATISLTEEIDKLKVAKQATIDGFICERFSEPVTLGLTAENQAFVKVIWHRKSI